MVPVTKEGRRKVVVRRWVEGGELLVVEVDSMEAEEGRRRGVDSVSSGIEERGIEARW